MAPTLHATLGASGAHRWIPCPGSIRMSAGMPNEGSVYAREGSAAHEIGEMALRSGKDAISYLGFTLAEYPEIDVDASMCAAVQEYLDAVRGEIQKYKEAGYDDFELGVEERFDLTHVYANMFGTCDAVLYLPASRKLIVFDYKHGWLSVPVERNPQTMYYAIGAVSGKHNREVDIIELVIVQPRTGSNTAIKRWSCDYEELMDFRAVLVDSAKRTEYVDSKLNPGEWCKFCTAAPVCRALYTRIGELIMMNAKNELPNPDKIPFEDLKPIWENANMIESWAKNFKAYVHNLAVKEGKLLPGTKLVEGRSYRDWIDEKLARKALKALKLMGELDGEIETVKLKSPNQIEDMLPKSAHGIIANLWSKGRGALTLVPATDKRVSVKANALDEFS